MTTVANHEAAPLATDHCQRGREPVIREGGSVEIPLTKGQVALVSPESYHLVRAVMWQAFWHPDTRSFYAQRGTHLNGRRISYHMHRVVLEAGVPAIQVDHINHDTLDNRLSNLRLATNAQNHANLRVRAGSRSGFKGVSWYKRDQNWHACITVAGKNRHLGYFPTAEEAGRAYDRAAREVFGEFACLNAAE